MKTQHFTPAMSNPRASWGPVAGFVPPSLEFCYSKSILHINLPYFDNLEFDIFMQVALSATSSRLLLLRLGFEHFQFKLNLVC